jgi:hypothetical protein
MKKIFFTILATGCITLVTPVANAAAFTDAPRLKAWEKLSRLYNNIPGKSWTRCDGGYYVEFILKGVKHRIFYDLNGKWSGSLKTYSESKLSNEIRNAIKHKYSSYTIFNVEEIETMESDGIPTYLIHLEDKTTFKLVRFFEGQIEVRQEFKKE